jgi:hypothetical protein
VRALRVLAIGLLTLVSACQFDPHSFSYTRHKPDMKTIVGSWVATDDTLRELAHTAYSKARPTISLAVDGAIRMADIPDAWSDGFGDGKGALETFVGTWQLEENQDVWSVGIRRPEWGCGNCIAILGQSPPYRLFIHVGDPDVGRGYEFRKVN